MRLIAGLGNPGAQYRETRHNAGFLFLDAFALATHLAWKVTKGSFSLAGPVPGTDALLVKPLTYMNLSGIAVASIAGLRQVQPEDVLIIYDDVHLQPLTYKIKVGGGSGGHNGIKSVTECLGTDAYTRLRLGVGLQASAGGLVEYVLGTFSAAALREFFVFAESLFPLVSAFASGGTQEMLNMHSRLSAGPVPPHNGGIVS